MKNLLIMCSLIILISCSESVKEVPLNNIEKIGSDWIENGTSEKFTGVSFYNETMRNGEEESIKVFYEQGRVYKIVTSDIYDDEEYVSTISKDTVLVEIFDKVSSELKESFCSKNTDNDINEIYENGNKIDGPNRSFILRGQSSIDLPREDCL